MRASALIGTYNGAALVERAIASLLAQTVADIEVLVVDDGSTDETPRVLEAAAARDPRVRVLTMERNVGIARSLNAGLAAAQAPVVAILDHDDWAVPERIERQLAVFDAHPEIAVVGSRVREEDASGHELSPRTSFGAGDVTATLMRFNPIPNSCAALRRDVALAAGGYDPRYRFANDYDLWLRIADHHRLWTIDEPLSARVMTGENFGASNERAQTAETLAIRLATLRRRRTLRGAGGLVVPALAWLTPEALKRARRRRLGQAP